MSMLPMLIHSSASVALGQIFMTISAGTNSDEISYFGRTGDTIARVGGFSLSGGRGSVVPGQLNISDTGVYLAGIYTISGVPVIQLAKNTSGTWAEITAPTVSGGSAGGGICFAPNADYMAVAVSGAPRLEIYKRSGDTFSASGVTISGSLGVSGAEICYSNDGNFVFMALTGNPGIYAFSRTGDTFTKLADPSTLPGGSGSAIDVSPDGQLVVFGNSVAGTYLWAYYFNGTTLAYIAGCVDTAPAALPRCIRFSKDGLWVAVTSFSSPYLQIYAVSGTGSSSTLTLQTLSGGNPSGAAYSVDFDSTSTYCVVCYQATGSPISNVSLYKLISGSWTFQHKIARDLTNLDYRNLVWDRDR